MFYARVLCRRFLLATLTFGLAVACWTAPVFAQVATRQGDGYLVSQRHDFTVEPGGRLDMDRLSAGVTITSWDASRVEVVEEVHVNEDDETSALRHTERAMSAVTQAQNEIRVRGQGGGRYLDRHFEIKVPRRFDVLVETEGGNLSIAGLEGRVDLTTSGGSIRLTQIVGRVDARTSGGWLEFSDLQGDVEAVTSGGDLRLTGIAGTVRATTAGGDVDIRDIEGDLETATAGGDITVQRVEGRLDASTAGGDIDVSAVRDAVRASTAGGDIEIQDIGGAVVAATSGGDIVGRTLLGRLDLKTSAGDIELRDVRAPVEAETSVGDIVLEITLVDFSGANDLYLETSHGDIELTLPSDFPARIDAEVRRNGWFDGGDIYSDFALLRETDGEDESRSRVLRSHGTVNGGGNRVFLRTTGGDIYIRERNP